MAATSPCASGDNLNGAVGTFFEGFIASGVTLDETDDKIQASNRCRRVQDAASAGPVTDVLNYIVEF